MIDHLINFQMDKEHALGLMAQNMLVNLKMGKSVVMELKLI